MIKNDLCVCFCNSARKEDEALLHEVSQEVVAHFPQAISLCIGREMGCNSNRAELARGSYRTSINGEDIDTAFQYADKYLTGRKVIVVAICDDFIRAAKARDLTVVSVGIREEIAQYHAALPKYVPEAIRNLTRIPA